MNHPKLAGEEDLLFEASQGSGKAFDALYLHYKDRLLRHTQNITNLDETELKDLRQEVFTIMWIKRKELSTVKCFEGYALVAFRNTLLNSERQKRARARVFENYTGNVKPYHDDTSEAIWYNCLHRSAVEAIKLLPPKCAEVYKLYALHEFSQKQIAAYLNISTQMVGQHIILAQKKLAAHPPYAELLVNLVIIFLMCRL